MCVLFIDPNRFLHRQSVLLCVLLDPTTYWSDVCIRRLLVRTCVRTYVCMYTEQIDIDRHQIETEEAIPE